MTGGISCGFLLLYRSKKPEPKWFFLIDLLEVYVDPCGEDEVPRFRGFDRGWRQTHGSEGRSNS